MFISVWHSFFKLLRANSGLVPSAKRRRNSRSLGHVERVEERVLLTGNLSITDAYLATSAGVRLPSGTVPVEGEAIYLRIDWNENGVSNFEDYRLGFQLNQYLMQVGPTGPSSGFYTGTNTNRNLSNTQFVGYAQPGLNNITAVLDITGTVNENTIDNQRLFTFVAADPVDPLSANPFPQGMITPVTGTPFKDWFRYYPDSDPRPTGAQDFVDDYTGGPYAQDGQFGDNYTLVNFSAMDYAGTRGGVAVQAVAPGTVLSVVDGNYDRNTNSPNVVANSVTIDLGNTWTAQYNGFLSGSITVKAGDTVDTADILGLLGSSGNSNRPALNFRLFHNGFLVNPNYALAKYFATAPTYEGNAPFNVLDAGVTNTDPGPDFAERPQEYTTFSTGGSSRVYFWLAADRLLPTEPVIATFYRPNGTTATTIPVTATQASAGNYYFYYIDSGIYGTATGTWQVAATVGGTEVVRKSFNVSSSNGAPEIRVQQELPNNQSLNLLNDRTTPVDFGTWNVGNALRDVTFTIQNTGASTLTLGSPVIPTGFSLTTAFPNSVAAGGSAQFTVRLNTLVRGQSYGTVSFNSNDPDEQKFRFTVTGIVNTPSNSGPDIDLPAPALRYQYQMFPQVISPNAQIVTPGAFGFGAASTLQVTFAAGGRAEDFLGIRNQGTSPGQIGINGANVTFGGTNFGSFVIANDAVSGAKKINFTFTSAVTQAALQTLLQNITYFNSSTVPNTHPRYVQFELRNQGNFISDLPVAVVAVVPDTHPPEVSLLATPVTIPGALTQDFEVVYTDEVSVDASSLDRFDLQYVRGPIGNTFAPTFFTKDSTVNDLQRSTFWTMPGPGGFWDIRDNGVYEVVLDHDQVRDINGNITLPQVVGTFTINLPNSPAVITNTIGGQFTQEDTPTSPIAITIDDLETAPTALVLTAISSNPNIVAANGFTFGGSGRDRTLIINPVANAFGVTTITLQLQDEHGGFTTKSFNLTVQSVNDLPVVSTIPDQDIQQDTSTPTVAFTVADVETAPASLQVVATSDNLSLVKNNQIVIGGTPANPTIKVTPEPGQFGVANVSVKVTDTDGGITTNIFSILIRENSIPPVIPLNQVLSFPENSASGTPIGIVIATDADAGQTLTYAITGGDIDQAFSIDPASGALSVRTQASFDFEVRNQYDLTISVTDDSFPGVTTSGTVRVNVTNVNETPVVQSKVLSLSENPPLNQSIVQVTATDVDAGQTRTFSITSGNRNNAFVIDPVTGVISVNNSTAVDFEAGSQMVLTISAADNGTPPLTGFGTVTINLGNVNEPPTIAAQGFTIPENSANGTPVGTVLAFDQDNGQTVRYSIVGGNADGAFAINATTGAITVLNSAALNFEALAAHVLIVQVNDNANPSLSSSNTVTITLSDVNEAPTITAQTFSIDENSALNTPVGVVATGNPEPGQTLSFSIASGNNGNAFAINPITGELRVANPSALNYEITPTFTLTLQASDNGNPVQFGTGTITVNLNNVNETPVVQTQVFSINENLQAGTSVNSVAATDPDVGQVLTFAITNASVPGVFTINPQSGQLTIADSAGLNYEVNPTITLTVQVSDSGAPTLSASATVTINLQDLNDSPVVPAQTLTFAENQVSGFVVSFANATDEDLPPQTLTYSIVGGNNGGAFAIDPVTGRITVANASAVNYEVTPQFQLQVQARDNGATQRTGVGIVTINLTDVNEPPVVPVQKLIVPENSPAGFVVGNVLVNNPETSQVLFYEVLSGNELGVFAVNSQTGQVTVADSSLLNFENPQTFVLALRVTDNGTPSLTEIGQLTIEIGDVNEVPVFPAPYELTLDENTATGTVLGTIQATDPDIGQNLIYSIIDGNQGNPFVLNPTTGVLSVGQSALLDFESRQVITLTIEVLDDGSPRKQATTTVTVHLRDVNDPPRITGQAFIVDENAAAQSLVGTVAASEQDAGQTISYQILSGNVSGAFAINAQTGVLTVANSAAIDFETRNTFNLVVQVTDSASPTRASSTAPVTVSVRNINEPPVILPQTLSVPENSPQGTEVGAVQAVDLEPGQSVSFAIVSGNTNDAFSINSSTGAITVANPAMLNFETHPTFSLLIRTTDNASVPLSSTAVLTINLINVNEPPQVANQSISLQENTPDGTVVGQVSATDPDSLDLVYSITAGNVGDAFRIDPVTGEISVNDSTVLNYEARQVIVLTVRVTDPSNAFTTASVSAVLSNVNDLPVVSDTEFTITENSAADTVVGKMVATDQDAGQSLTFSIVSGNPNGAFAIHPTTGKLTVANASMLDFETTPVFHLGIRVTDNGSPSTSRTVTASVSLSNIDEPLGINFRPAQTPVQPGQKRVSVDSGAVVRDPDSPDAGLLGVTLTVSLSSDTAGRGDKLEILPGANGLTIKGKSLYIGDVKVATFAGGKPGTPLFISFTADATQESLQTIVRSIAISLGRKHGSETMDVKFRLSGTAGIGGSPAVKTLTFTPDQTARSAGTTRKSK